MDQIPKEVHCGKLKSLESNVDAFPMIGDHLCRLVGNGRKVRLEGDLWVGGQEVFKMTEALRAFLHNKNKVYLRDVYLKEREREGGGRLMKDGDLVLTGMVAEVWTGFRQALITQIVHIKEQLDSVVWGPNKN
jgi:hypothetical protein